MATPTRVLRPTLEAAEDAIVAALAGDATIAAYIMDVVSWQGTLEDAVQEAVIREPAILVLCAGAEFEERGALEHIASVEWHIVVKHRSLRGERYRRAPAAPGEVGTYQMVQDVLRVLVGQDLELEGMSPLAPKAVELLQTSSSKDRAQSAYTLIFTSELDHVVVAPEDTLTELGFGYELRNEGADTWVAAADADIFPAEEATDE